MKIKELYLKADDECKKFWRGSLLQNYALLQTYLWFSLLENPRNMILKIGEEVVDDGKPVENIHFEDIYKAAHSLNPAFAMQSVELNHFLDWFLDLEEETYKEETEDDFSNFLCFSYMVRAWNDYIKKEAVFIQE